MNLNVIGKLMLVVYDALKDDANSKEIISELDYASNDDVIKENFKKAIIRLREIDKSDIADHIEQEMK